MIKKYYRCGASVLLEADSRMIADTECCIGSYFDYETMPNHVFDTWHIMFEDQEERFLQMGLEKLIVRQISEPDIHVYLDGNRKKIGLLKENNHSWQVQNIVRMVRVLLRLQCQENGTVFLHGGCLAYRGKGICFLGGKKSGKTSSILSFLKYKEAEFIANDDVSVYSNGGILYAQGWPRSVVIRQDTWENLGIADYNLLHPLNSRTEGPCLYPQQVGSLFARGYLTEITADYIVFPRFIEDNKTEIAYIQKEDAKERLKAQVLQNPGKYNEYLLPYFKEKNNCNEIEKAMINKIHFVELKQNFNSLKNGTDALAELIDEELANGRLG